MFAEGPTDAFEYSRCAPVLFFVVRTRNHDGKQAAWVAISNGIVHSILVEIQAAREPHWIFTDEPSLRRVVPTRPIVHQPSLGVMLPTCVTVPRERNS